MGKYDLIKVDGLENEDSVMKIGKLLDENVKDSEVD